MAVKEFLFTGATLTVISIGFFFSMENPAAVLEKKILLDALSGLGSRSSYEYDMEKYDKEFMENKETPFTFVFIDINNLRSINGLYGHQEGDYAIQSLAKALEQVTGEKGICARYGGDEFAFAFLEPESMLPELERIRECIETEARRICGPKAYLISASLGATSCPADNHPSLDQILAEAGRTLYADKSTRKGRAADPAKKHSRAH
jgi:diguanylate cyclase (GGDEF)-like protein